MELLAGIIVPLLKWIFGKIANKKLNDKEFIEYVTAHQKKISHAGDTAIAWEEALAQARAELEPPLPPAEVAAVVEAAPEATKVKGKAKGKVKEKAFKIE